MIEVHIAKAGCFSGHPQQVLLPCRKGCETFGERNKRNLPGPWLLCPYGPLACLSLPCCTVVITAAWHVYWGVVLALRSEHAASTLHQTGTSMRMLCRWRGRRWIGHSLHRGYLMRSCQSGCVWQWQDCLCIRVVFTGLVAWPTGLLVTMWSKTVRQKTCVALSLWFQHGLVRTHTQF